MRRFNPERELRKIQYGGRNRIILSMLFGIILLAIGYSFALYQVRYSKRLIYTKVAPFSTKDIQLAVKVEGEEGSLDYFPPKEESYVYVKTECEKEDVTEVEWKEADWKLNLLTSGPNKCTVTFRQLKQTITTEVVGNGRVEPPEQEVVKGKNSGAFSVIPDEGNALDSVSCDNSQQVTREGNTFIVNNVTSDTKCTINIAKEYTITAAVTANGTVQPESQKVLENKDSEEFTIKPNEGYKVDKVECTNEQQVSITENTFKVTKVTNDSDCTITIKEKPRTLFEYCSTNEQLSTCIPKALELDNLEEDDTKDKNIRYVGATPNNYIWFNCDNYSLVTDAETAASQNCEKWRIIGYMKDKSRVKIIRAESVGNMQWDTSGSNGSNHWNRPAELRTSLVTYYNGTKIGDSTKGITSATRSMISSVTWNLGGQSTSVATAQTFYNAERGSTGGGAAPTQTTWTGYIGLMYPSDYGYAADKSCWGTNLNGYNSSCKNSDWLWDSITTQWTLTPYSDLSYIVFAVSSDGSVSGSNGAKYSRAVRPSLYLNSSVKIKGEAETGGAEAPYIIVP